MLFYMFGRIKFVIKVNFTCVFFTFLNAAAAKSLQSCPTLCNPIDVWQPTSLPHPWDSPGKSTGVGCHFLLQCMKVKVKVKSLSRVQLLATHGLQPTGLFRPWDFPGKSTAVGCHCLLQMDPNAHYYNAHLL